MSSLAFAQYETAPSNYYPSNFNGNTFTGTVTDTGEKQITLTYTRGSKMDMFTSSFESACSVPGGFAAITNF
jgi:hypothetical protein